MSEEKVNIIFEDDPSYTLFPHQLKTKEWINERMKMDFHGIRGVVLQHKMGLGKTLITLDYTSNYKGPTLLISSLDAVEKVWEDEIKKFFPNEKYLVYRKDRCKFYDTLTKEKMEKYKWIIINYDSLVKIYTEFELDKRTLIMSDNDRKIGVLKSTKPKNTDKYMGKRLLFEYPFEYIAADECHKFNNHKTKTFQAVMALYGEKKIAISGTVVRNKFKEIYPIIRFLGYDEELITSQFKQKHYIDQNLVDCIMYMDDVDAKVKMAEIEFNTIKLKLEGRERDIYKYYLNAARETHERFLIGTVDFSNILVLFTRLQQICIAPYTILAESSRKYKENEDEKKNYAIAQQILDKMTQGLSSWLHNRDGTSGLRSAKIARLIEELKKIGDEKAIIFSRFTRVSDLIASAMDDELPDMGYLLYDGGTGKDKTAVLNAFENKRKKQVLICTSKTGSESLNLQCATRVFIIGGEWTWATKSQAWSRTWRMGQTKKVFVTEMYIDDSIEDRMNDLCNQKKEIADEVIGRGSGQTSAHIGEILNYTEIDDK